MDLGDSFRKVRPFEKGFIKDWNAMIDIWQYSFDTLQVDPLKHPVLLVVGSIVSKKDLTRIIEIFFETFRVPNFKISTSGLPVLYASGRTTGLVVDAGEGQIRITSIHEGITLDHASLIISVTAEQDNLPLHEGIHASIQKCDTSLHGELYRNIILSGGSTLFEGFKEELEKKLGRLVTAGNEIRVFAPAERWNSAWIGGSILASLKTLPGFWISRLEYLARGKNVINRII